MLEVSKTPPWPPAVFYLDLERYLGAAPSAVERLAALVDPEVRERVDAYDRRLRRLRECPAPNPDWYGYVEISA